MKDFIGNYKIPLILGGCAVIAIIATLIIVTGGFSSNYGLYITSVYGRVSVTSSDVSSSAESGEALRQGDVVTIGADSSCTLAYQGKKNSENNYLVLGSDTQIVVSDEFNGKNSGELFLRSGTVIGNFADDDKASVLVRTADSMITLNKSVSKISYYTNEFMSYTDLYTFMGDNMIQLYDAGGAAVNDPELQIEKMWGRIICGSGMSSDPNGEIEDGPSFEALNLSFDLSELTVFDLKQLLTISALVKEGFPYDAADLKAVYDEKGGAESSAPEDGSSAENSVTEDNSSSIQTAEPIITSPPPTETTLPGQTAAPVYTNPPVSTTAPAADTTSETSYNGNTVHIVTIDIDGDETIQEVPHGGNAVKPEDPVIDGMVFVGWDNSFENITEDKVITAIFSNGSGAVFHTVTVVIGDKSTELTVEHGKSANLPSTVDVEGHIFKGWDKDYTNITEDITITAILEITSEDAVFHTVTFVINGESYNVPVPHGGTAVPPYTPPYDAGFIGWDKSFDNISADTRITAIFSAVTEHNVTFVIDGQYFYTVVRDGGTAVPPFLPSYDTGFIGWDRSLDNITSDVTITAVYSY